MNYEDFEKFAQIIADVADKEDEAFRAMWRIVQQLATATSVQDVAQARQQAQAMIADSYNQELIDGLGATMNFGDYMDKPAISISQEDFAGKVLKAIPLPELTHAKEMSSHVQKQLYEHTIACSECTSTNSVDHLCPQGANLANIKLFWLQSVHSIEQGHEQPYSANGVTLKQATPITVGSED